MSEELHGAGYNTLLRFLDLILVSRFIRELSVGGQKYFLEL